MSCINSWKYSWKQAHSIYPTYVSVLLSFVYLLPQIAIYSVLQPQISFSELFNHPQCQIWSLLTEAWTVGSLLDHSMSNRAKQSQNQDLNNCLSNEDGKIVIQTGVSRGVQWLLHYYIIQPIKGSGGTYPINMLLLMYMCIASYYRNTICMCFLKHTTSRSFQWLCIFSFEHKNICNLSEHSPQSYYTWEKTASTRFLPLHVLRSLSPIDVKWPSSWQICPSCPSWYHTFPSVWITCDVKW